MNPEPNQTENKPENKNPIKSLRTFQGDVQEAIAKNNFSTASVLVAEQKKKLENPAPEVMEVKSKVRNSSFAIFGAVIIAIGLTIVSGVYYLKSKEQVVVEKKTRTFMTYTEEKSIKLDNINKAELFKKFNEFKNNWSSQVNSVMYNTVFLNEKEVSVGELLSMIGPNMPSSLVRSFGSKYMLGVLSYDKNDPFIILSVDDFISAYPGMLKWEGSMSKDLKEFFEINSIVENTSSSTHEISEDVFIDETIKNRDIRALKDKSGNAILIYSFIDRKTLVITKDENTLSAIVGNLILNKQVK